MKKIKLTQNKEAIVDDDMYEYLSQWKWSAYWAETTQSYYAARKENNKNVYMHRLVMKTPLNMLCDHQNHNTLDDRKHNLRNVTRSQSLMNRRVYSNNKLQEKCISQYYNGFLVRIHKGKKCVFSKTYRTLQEAKIARDKFLEKYHGKFMYRR